MKKMILLLILFRLCNSALSQTNSLELICSGGDTYINTDYQLNWSLGETVNETFTGGDYILTQGFHQSSYEISGLENLNDIGIQISVYPNPGSNLISVEFKNLSYSEDFSDLILTDINGNILQSKIILSNIEHFDLTNYAKGVYFLLLKQEDQFVNTIKIIKN